MKRTTQIFKIINGIFFVLPLVYYVEAQGQQLASIETNYHLPSQYIHENNNETAMHGAWFSFADDGRLEKAEIYNNGDLQQIYYGKEAEQILLAHKIKDAKERIHYNLNSIEILYKSAEGKEESKKVLLNTYKILILDLIDQIENTKELSSLEPLVRESRLLNQKARNLFPVSTIELEIKLARLNDLNEIKTAFME